MTARPHPLACVLLSGTALVSGCGPGPASTTSSSTAVPSLGHEVRDGDFAFTVTRFERGMPRIRNHTPRGQYVAVVMTVKNVGTHPETYVGANQKLKDIAGRTFTPDDTTDAAVNDDQGFADIQPGSQIQVAAVFDVPPDTVPASVELHGSPSSTGATVNLDR
ncbi:MAG: Telomeric repeat-binding factor 2 [Mycobacterium sp.]|jgi:hypothetical protein|nr:Telomeric repeat-binding factor 2 [Mycobacterium sp.]